MSESSVNDVLASMLRTSSADKEKIRNALTMLRTGEISFEEFIQLSDTKEYKGLGKIKGLRVLSSLQGWTEHSAARAFMSYDIPLDASMRAIKGSDLHVKSLGALISSSPGDWQERTPAPEGWPWFGNVLDTVKMLDMDSLPSEMERTVRYKYDASDYSKNDQGGTSVDTTPHYVPQPDTPGVSQPSGDDLDDLFSMEDDGETEEEDFFDNLDDFLN